MACVLLIDDCCDSRERLHLALEHEGLDVIEAYDAVAGLQRAVEDAPDCVVVSGALAGLGGLEVTSRLASEISTARLPVLLRCDLVDAEFCRDAKRAGAAALLPRSARGPEIVGPVRDALWSVGLR